MKLSHRPTANRLEGHVDDQPTEQLFLAAQHYLGEVERADNRGECTAKEGGRPADHVIATRRGGRIHELRFESRRGDPGLETALLAANARLAPVSANNDMTDLARGKTAAMERAATEQKSGPDATTDAHEYPESLEERSLKRQFGPF